MSMQELRVLGQVLREEFGPDNTLGTTLDDVIDKLAQRGVRVARETVVNELRAASGGDLDAAAHKRWGPMFFFDESDNSIGAV